MKIFLMNNWQMWFWRLRSPMMPSASWRSRVVSGIIHSESKGLRTRGVDSVNFSLRAEEDKMRCPSTIGEIEKETKSAFLQL